MRENSFFQTAAASVCEADFFFFFPLTIFELCEPHSCVYLTQCNNGEDITAVWLVLMTHCIMGRTLSQVSQESRCMGFKLADGLQVCFFTPHLTTCDDIQ